MIDIAVIDYGMGNLRSVSKALEHVAPGLEYRVEYVRPLVGEFDVDLVHEFFQGFVNHAQVTLHIDNLRGANAHHQCETVFKAFGRALRAALAPDARAAGEIPSTKGKL